MIGRFENGLNIWRLWFFFSDLNNNFGEVMETTNEDTSYLEIIPSGVDGENLDSVRLSLSLSICLTGYMSGN